MCERVYVRMVGTSSATSLSAIGLSPTPPPTTPGTFFVFQTLEPDPETSKEEQEVWTVVDDALRLA